MSKFILQLDARQCLPRLTFFCTIWQKIKKNLAEFISCTFSAFLLLLTFIHNSDLKNSNWTNIFKPEQNSITNAHFYFLFNFNLFLNRRFNILDNKDNVTSTHTNLILGKQKIFINKVISKMQ